MAFDDAVPAGLPVLSSMTDDGIAIITFNRSRKLNGWSAEVIEGFTNALVSANADPACKAAVMTGTGRYFSSGADFSGMLGPMLPSTLMAFAAKHNHDIFDAFITFTKPLIMALNGKLFTAPPPSCRAHTPDLPPLFF